MFELMLMLMLMFVFVFMLCEVRFSVDVGLKFTIVVLLLFHAASCLLCDAFVEGFLCHACCLMLSLLSRACST